MTTSDIRPRTGVDQLIGDATNLRVQLENASLSPDDARVAVRALTAALRSLHDQCDEYAAKLESFKAERSELCRRVDALRAENDNWRAQAYAKRMVP